MALLRRDQIPVVELPTQEAACAALGGDVLVRGMDLADWLRFAAHRQRVEAPLEDELPEDTAQRIGGELVPLGLHLCVLAADRKPVYSAAQWAAWSVRHPSEAMQLFEIAMRLSGHDVDGEKKS